jgi:hypothetical protein
MDSSDIRPCSYYDEEGPSDEDDEEDDEDDMENDDEFGPDAEIGGTMRHFVDRVGIAKATLRRHTERPFPGQQAASTTGPGWQDGANWPKPS